MNPHRIDSYQVSNIGTCLFLKLCGFIDEVRASILNVDEEHLFLKVRPSRWPVWTGEGNGFPHMDIEIRISPVGAAGWRYPQAQIDVIVRDKSWFSNPARFEAASRRLLWKLRGHLMVQ